jgi:hypothetical protein
VDGGGCEVDLEWAASVVVQFRKWFVDKVRVNGGLQRKSTEIEGFALACTGWALLMSFPTDDTQFVGG